MDSNLAMWSGIVGFFLPPFISAIMRTGWGNTPRAIVAFLVCLVAAAGTTYFQGQFDAANLVKSALVITTLSIATFKGLWNKTGVTDAIEGVTNGRPGPIT